MPVIVEVEGYGPVELPDGMTREEMAAAIKKLPPLRNQFDPAPPPPPVTSGEERQERMFYGGVGAGIGATASGAQLLGRGAMAAAGRLEGARERARIAEQERARAASTSPFGTTPTATPPQLAPNAQRILQGTTEEGATGRARMQGFNLETAQQAAAAKEQERLLQTLQQQGVVERGAKGVLAGAPGMTSTPSGVVFPRTESAQTIGPRGPEGQVGATQRPRPSAIASGLEEVSSLFRNMMQSAPMRGLGTALKYAAPPVALGSAGLDIGDIVIEQRKGEQADRLKQALAGLSATGAVTSLANPPVGLTMMAVPPLVRGYQEHQRLMETDPEYAQRYQQAFGGMGGVRRFPKPEDIGLQ